MAKPNGKRVTRPQDSVLRSAFKSGLRSAALYFVVMPAIGVGVALFSSDPGPTPPKPQAKAVSPQKVDAAGDIVNTFAPTDKESAKQLAAMVGKAIRLDHVTRTTRSGPQHRP